MARLGWGSGQFKWSAGSPQKQNLQLSCSLIDTPPPPQTGTYAKPSIFDCRHNPGPSVASTPKAKGSAARENRLSVAMETVCSHLQLYNPPPLSSSSSSPSNPFQISAPPPTRSGGWFRRGGGSGRKRESLPLEQRLRRWRRRLLNVSGSIVIIALFYRFL